MAEMNSRSAVFTGAVIVLAIVTVTAITVLAIFKPGDTSTGTIILGTLGPIIAAFLAAALKDLHGAVNSRLTELIDSERIRSHAEGKLEQRIETENGISR